MQIDISKMNILTNAEGTNVMKAICGCMGVTLTTLQLYKTFGYKNVAIPRKSKTVKRRSSVLDKAVEFNLVARTESQHYTNGTYYTYTITGFGFAVLQQMYNMSFHLLPQK